MKSEVCGSCEQYTGPTSVHSPLLILQSTSSRASQLKKKKKKKKRKENAKHQTLAFFIRIQTPSMKAFGLRLLFHADAFQPFFFFFKPTPIAPFMGHEQCKQTNEQCFGVNSNPEIIFLLFLIFSFSKVSGIQTHLISTCIN